MPCMIARLRLAAQIEDTLLYCAIGTRLSELSNSN